MPVEIIKIAELVGEEIDTVFGRHLMGVHSEESAIVIESAKAVAAIFNKLSGVVFPTA